MTFTFEKNTNFTHRQRGRAGGCFSERVRNQRRQTGFTLIELLFVVILVAILAGVIVAGLDTDGQNDERLNSYSMAEMARALHQFKQDVGHYPDDDGSPALNATPERRLNLLLGCNTGDDDGCTTYNIDTRRGWNGSYLVDKNRVEFPASSGVFVFADAWSTPLELAIDTPRLISYGADRVYAGDHPTNLCLPNGDDVVLCL
jgi:prepilin-type N-terminal cleavage/methylation domain-containing protein